MHSVYIFLGLERYVLVRAGTTTSPDAERIEPRRARALLGAALRRDDPHLIRRLARLLGMSDEAPERIAERALARVSASGPIGMQLVMLRVEFDDVHADQPEQPDEPDEREDDEEDDEEEDGPPRAKTTVRVSLFFDGTANNRANTRERLAAEAAGRRFTKSGSYDNDESNVSRLETLLHGDSSFEHSFSIYVEGIGTTDGEGDSLWGMATGMGGTGVPAKVARGVNELLRGLRERGIPAGTVIEKLHIDTVGFSRGAAAARHCVHFCLDGDNPLQPRVEALGWPVELLEFNFVGLYDTVASYGLNHSNDTRDLDLDAIRVAKKVVQLAAAEEHRKNFRLTNIDSAVAAGVGIELYFPGVHSDIGGGYTDFYDEVGLEILDFDVLWSTRALERRFEREREWLIESGWYRANEIAEVNFWNELKVTKRGIRFHYNRIPLAHMQDFAAQTGLEFDPSSERFPVPAALGTVAGLVAAHVAAHLGGGSTAEHWINLRTPEIRTLRHDYLHFSSFYGSLSNPPQFTNNDPMYGRRQRIVQNG